MLRKRLSSAPRRLVAFYWGSGIADDVPALTYYLLLSLAPFCLGLAALGALLFGDELSPRVVAEEVSRYLPVSVRGDVVELVMDTKRDSPRLLALAIATMLWTTSGAIGVIERCVSRITGGARYQMTVGKLYHLGVGLALSVLLIAATMAASLAGGLSDELPVAGPWLARAVAVVNFACSMLFCALIVRYAPRRRLAWRCALAGALVPAVMLLVAPVLVGLYFGAVATLAPASVFLSLAVVLFGCMALSQGFLIGAGIAARAQVRRDAQS